MAKEVTARGGARVGAGRRPKELADKIALGRPAEVISLPEPPEMEGTDILPMKEYIKASQKSGIELCAENVLKASTCG